MNVYAVIETFENSQGAWDKDLIGVFADRGLARGCIERRAKELNDVARQVYPNVFLGGKETWIIRKVEVQ